METVGFIGLGNMGGPVAGHIQRAGYPLVVCDLRVEATRSFRERGAVIADSPAELARRCDVIITALPMPKDVEQVACGAKGILDGIKSGSVYIDISTSAPSLIRKLEPRFRAKGSFVLDAPVASGQPGAERGIHEVMVGGEHEIFERVKPILAAFGDQVLYAGPLGSGSICIIKCRRRFFEGNSKRIPFLLSCCAKMSAWQLPWVGSLPYRCHWPAHQSKN